MSDNNIEIFLNEEYGYRTWVWKPKMTEEEFVGWWESLTETDIIKYFFNIRTLPGILTEHSVAEIEPDSDENTDSGNNITPRMYGDPKTYLPHYYCHMHDVDDSFMCIGNIRYPFRRTTRRDWKENWIDWQLKNNKPVAS